ncbi:hypothetical protein E4U41_000823 [Claviceps citrina]|nr:hypothetical protein E4U41_000823 [Claviceps citrina]
MGPEIQQLPEKETGTEQETPFSRRSRVERPAVGRRRRTVGHRSKQRRRGEPVLMLQLSRGTARIVMVKVVAIAGTRTQQQPQRAQHKHSNKLLHSTASLAQPTAADFSFSF